MSKNESSGLKINMIKLKQSISNGQFVYLTINKQLIKAVNTSYSPIHTQLY